MSALDVFVFLLPIGGAASHEQAKDLSLVQYRRSAS